MAGAEADTDPDAVQLAPGASADLQVVVDPGTAGGKAGLGGGSFDGKRRSSLERRASYEKDGKEGKEAAGGGEGKGGKKGKGGKEEAPADPRDGPLPSKMELVKQCKADWR